MLTSLVRGFGIITGALLSWFMAFGILMHLGLWGWHAVDVGLAYGVETLRSELSTTAITWNPPSYTAGPAPDIRLSLLWTIRIALVGTLVGLLVSFITPLRSQCKREVGKIQWADSKAVPSGHLLDDEIQAIKKMFGAGGRIEFRVLNTDSPVAFAMSVPFRSMIVMSSGMLNRLSPIERQWVMAHEMSHVKHRDSSMASTWLASMKALYVGRHFLVRLVNIKLRMLVMLRAWPSLIRLMGMLWKFVITLTNIGINVGQRFFLLLDRWAARRIEFRADNEAANHFGVQPGVDVLKKIGGVGEPLFNGLFATHPPISERITRIRELEASPGASETV